ncbi:MAG: hypothetical protein AB1564_17475 [Chloroflexota bacterium]
MPQYGLRIQVEGDELIFDPQPPQPIVHYLSVRQGDTDVVEFYLTAIASGQAVITASVSYEVHLENGLAYWGYRSAKSHVMAVSP